MKRVLVFAAVLGLAASLGAQSLADLAKKEKARREAYKDHPAVVIRNADLLRVQKTPAVEVVIPGGTTAGEAAAGTSSEIEVATVEDQGGSTGLAAGTAAGSDTAVVPQVEANGPLITGEANLDAGESRGGPLEVQLKAAQEQVDLLTTKMAVLRQQFEAQDAMVPGYVIQQQLDETSQKLLKAQAQQARIEALMAKAGTVKKAPGESNR